MELKDGYKKVSPGSEDGFLLEYKIGSLICMRLCNDNKIIAFKFARNFDGAGKFDDIIYCLIKKNINGEVEKMCVCVQVKSRKNSVITLNDLKITSSEAPFSLKTYYESYREIIKKMYGSVNDSTKFVLYTSAAVASSIPPGCLIEVQGDPILNTSPIHNGSEDNRKLGGVFQLDYNFFKEIVDSDEAKRFTEDFYIYAGQANLDTLDNLIDSEIKIASKKLPKYFVGCVRRELAELVGKTTDGKGEIVNNAKIRNVFAMAKNHLTSLFHETFLKDVEKIILKKGCLAIIHSNSDSTKLFKNALYLTQISIDDDLKMAKVIKLYDLAYKDKTIILDCKNKDLSRDIDKIIAFIAYLLKDGNKLIVLTCDVNRIDNVLRRWLHNVILFEITTPFPQIVEPVVLEKYYQSNLLQMFENEMYVNERKETDESLTST